MISGGKGWRRYSDSRSRLSPTAVYLAKPRRMFRCQRFLYIPSSYVSSVKRVPRFVVIHGGFLFHGGCETGPPSVPRLVMTVCSGMGVEAESKPSSQPPERGGLPERSACITTTARSTNLVAYGTSRNVRSTLGEIRPKIPTAGQGRKLFCFRRHNCSINLSNNGPLNAGFLDNGPRAGDVTMAMSNNVGYPLDQIAAGRGGFPVVTALCAA